MNDSVTPFSMLVDIVLIRQQRSGRRWGEASAFQLLTTLSIAGNALTGALPPTWCNDMTSLPAVQVCGIVVLCTVTKRMCIQRVPSA